MASSKPATTMCKITGQPRKREKDREREGAGRMSYSITVILWTAPFTILHHSLTGDISCDPSLSHTSVIPEGKKTLKRAGNSKVKLSTAFYAAWQTPLVG